MLDNGPYKPEVLQVDVATAAIKGSRDYQEDSLISSFPMGQATGFAVVADGLGGHAAGDVASALVTAEVFSYLKMREGALELGTLDIPQVLRDAAQAANDRVTREVKSDDALYGMGSTLLVPVISGDRLNWISIGDSPLFLFRDGELRQINKDHSMAPQLDMMVKVGAMAAEIAKDHPERNALTSVVNGEKIALIDCPATPTKLFPGDIIIASTDGLQYLTNEAIEQILFNLRDGSSGDITNALLAEINALDDPDQDNTAIVAIKFSGDKNADTSHASEDAPELTVVPNAQSQSTPAGAVLTDTTIEKTAAADVTGPQTDPIIPSKAVEAPNAEDKATAVREPKSAPTFPEVKVEKIAHNLDTPAKVIVPEEPAVELKHTVRVVTAAVPAEEPAAAEKAAPRPRTLHCSAIARASAAASAADRILNNLPEPDHEVREVLPTPDQEVAAELRQTMDAPRAPKTFWYRGHKHAK